MSSTKRRDNKAIVDRWFTEFWGESWNPETVEELGARDILLQYLLQAPRRGRADVKTLMTEFREAFPDPSVTGATDFVCEGRLCCRTLGRLGHSHGSRYCDFLVGCLPVASAEKMRFSGTTVLRISNGKIAEQISLDDGVTALLQLGLRGVA